MTWVLMWALSVVTQDGAWLTWQLPPYGTAECSTPIHLFFHEAYLGPGTGIWDYYDGNQQWPINQTVYHLSPGKPEVGCAIMWEGSDGGGVALPYWPVAHDPLWQPLPPQCQPFNHHVDGMTWEGI